MTFSNLSKKKISIVSFVVVILIVFLSLSGCTKQVSRGWSGVAVNENQLIVGSLNGVIIGLDANNRDKLFNNISLTTTTSGAFLSCGASSVSTYIYGTPALAADMDMMFIAGYNGKVYAYTISKGLERWRYPRDGNIKAVVGSICYDSGIIYFGSDDGKVYALDAQTGDLVWNEPFQTGSKIWSKPVVSENTVYITSFDKNIYALDIRDGSKKWSYSAGGAIVSSPLVYEDTLYFGALDRYFYAVKDGSLVWKTKEVARSWFWADPVMVNNYIYAANIDGKIYVLSPVDGRVLETYNAGYAISASPVVLGNNLICFATQRGEIWALDVTGGTIEKRYDYRARRNNNKINVYAPLAAKENTIYVVTTDNRLNALVSTQIDSAGFWLEPWSVSLAQ